MGHFLGKIDSVSQKDTGDTLVSIIWIAMDSLEDKGLPVRMCQQNHQEEECKKLPS